jgi:hypothetical protein
MLLNCTPELAACGPPLTPCRPGRKLFTLTAARRSVANVAKRPQLHRREVDTACRPPLALRTGSPALSRGQGIPNGVGIPVAPTHLNCYNPQGWQLPSNSSIPPKHLRNIVNSTEASTGPT